jgi:hypothetical protein
LKCCTFHAKCGVILAAGPFETPALLQRSGIGPASVLDQLCITKIITNEHVGRHLVGHYGCNIDFWLQFAPPTIPDPAQIESNLSLIAELPDLSLTTNLPTTIYPSSYVPSRAKQLFGSIDGSAPDGRYAVNIEYWSNLPRTEGSVEIVSLDAFTKPAINMPAFATVEERTALINTYKQIATELTTYVANYNAANPPTLSLSWPDKDPLTATDAEILNMGLQNAIKVHPSGTARMAQVGFGVVDGSFQVYGTCGLYVVDVSVLPIIPDADTPFTSMALGMYFAETLALSCKRRRCDPNAPDSYSLCRIITCCDCGTDPCVCDNKKGCNIKTFNKCDSDNVCCKSPCEDGNCSSSSSSSSGDDHQKETKTKKSKQPKPCSMDAKPHKHESSKSSNRQRDKQRQRRQQDATSSSGIYGWK